MCSRLICDGLFIVRLCAFGCFSRVLWQTLWMPRAGAVGRQVDECGWWCIVFEWRVEGVIRGCGNVEVLLLWTVQRGQAALEAEMSSFVELNVSSLCRSSCFFFLSSLMFASERTKMERVTSSVRNLASNNENLSLQRLTAQRKSTYLLHWVKVKLTKDLESETEALTCLWSRDMDILLFTPTKTRVKLTDKDTLMPLV